MKFKDGVVILLLSGMLLSLSACAADESKGLCSFLGGCGDDEDDDNAPAAPVKKKSDSMILE